MLEAARNGAGLRGVAPSVAVFRAKEVLSCTACTAPVIDQRENRMQDTAAYVLITALLVLPLVIVVVFGFEALLKFVFQNQLIMLVTPF